MDVDASGIMSRPVGVHWFELFGFIIKLFNLFGCELINGISTSTCQSFFDVINSLDLRCPGASLPLF